MRVHVIKAGVTLSFAVKAPPHIAYAAFSLVDRVDEGAREAAEALHRACLGEAAQLQQHHMRQFREGDGAGPLREVVGQQLQDLKRWGVEGRSSGEKGMAGRCSSST